jgi:hypothetical protein
MWTESERGIGLLRQRSAGSLFHVQRFYDDRLPAWRFSNKVAYRKLWGTEQNYAILTHQRRFAVSRTFDDVRRELETAEKRLLATSNQGERHAMLREIRSLLKQAEFVISEQLKTHNKPDPEQN